MNAEDNAKAYWQATLKLLGTVLAIWAFVAYGLGLIFASALNSIKLGGYPLGFWFAHQGAIYTFVILIFWYAKKMGQIDVKFGMAED